MAERFLLNLDEAIERHVPADTRLIVLSAIEGALEQVLRTDADNARWQRDLSVARDRVGDVLVAQGKLPEALKSFREGLAIRERLASAEPDATDSAGVGGLHLYSGRELSVLAGERP